MENVVAPKTVACAHRTAHPSVAADRHHRQSARGERSRRGSEPTCAGVVVCSHAGVGAASRGAAVALSQRAEPAAAPPPTSNSVARQPCCLRRGRRCPRAARGAGARVIQRLAGQPTAVPVPTCREGQQRFEGAWQCGVQHRARHRLVQAVEGAALVPETRARGRRVALARHVQEVPDHGGGWVVVRRVPRRVSDLSSVSCRKNRNFQACPLQQVPSFSKDRYPIVG